MLFSTTVKLLCTLAAFTVTALASPLSDTDATPCQSLQTKTLNFESPTGMPTNGLGGADWSGWSLYQANNSDILAKSGSHVIAASSQAGRISVYNGDYPYIGINSFYFACATYEAAYYGEYLPLGCSILVVGETDLRSGGIYSSGPYTFTPNVTELENGMPTPMTKVVLNAKAQYFYFYIVSGEAPSQLYLDNVVIEAENLKCI